MEESEEEVGNYRKKMYDPLEYGSESEERAIRKKHKKSKRADVGYGGKRYTYYEDRSDQSSDLEEAGFDDIEEEEEIAGIIGEKEDEEELQRQKEQRRRKRLRKQ